MKRATTKHPTKKPKRPTPQQVKAWLDTVIGPISNALRVEVYRAAKQRWSFDHRRATFESLWTVPAMVSPVFSPNLAQFLRFQPSTKAMCDAHDHALTQLLPACVAAFHALLDDTRFNEQCASAPEEDQKYFAEYVVNGIAELPEGRSEAEFWNVRAPDFLALRNRPGVLESFERLSSRGKTFQSVAEPLARKIDATRDELADEYGLPPVDPDSATT